VNDDANIVRGLVLFGRVVHREFDLVVTMVSLLSFAVETAEVQSCFLRGIFLTMTMMDEFIYVLPTLAS
jgi:hypothetical protein